MKEPTRLFDCIQYHLERTPLDDMLAAKENGQWKKYNTREVDELVNKLSAGLMLMGFGAGDKTDEGRDKIAVLSKNRPEWIILDLAVQQIGAVLTPVYPTISINELEFILTDAKVKLVFVNDEDLYHKVLSIQERVPSLQQTFTFEQVTGASHWKSILLQSTPEAISKVKTIADSIVSTDLATIIYTSGTTGTPKGVMLSHHNVLTKCIGFYTLLSTR